MRRSKYIFIALLLVAGSCTPATKFIVTNIGYEPLEVQESFIYALPQTNLIIGVQYQKEVFLPGPYCDYALKLLGIQGVNRSRTEIYEIINAKVKKSIEADKDHIYTMNLLEGGFSGSDISLLRQKGYLLTENLFSEENIVQEERSLISVDGVHFKDVTMESNIEMKEQTMYKTILTDTSFIRVPVVSEQLERKTIEKKAEEAAKLILEIRSDRYYLAAGIVDPFPQNFQLSTALNELDELEEKYLSLFIGKSYTQSFYREYFIIPEGSAETEKFAMGAFSPDAGFIVDGSSQGKELLLEIVPEGKTRSLRNLLPQQPEEEIYNKIYYRIPEICFVNLYKGEDMIHQERLSIFQSGAIVNIIKQ